MSNKLVLASSSPRRRMIVRLLDVDFDLVSPGIYERIPEFGEDPVVYCAQLALSKAQAVFKNCDSNQIVLGVDTIVTLEGRIMGKPVSTAQAAEMLQSLRDKNHLVYTAIALVTGSNCRVLERVTSTRVLMRNYSDEEIADYIGAGNCMDKAGAYAIQDPDFSPAIEINGCYMSVVGLPVCELIQLLNSTALLGTVGLKRISKDFDKCTYCPLAK